MIGAQGGVLHPPLTEVWKGFWKRKELYFFWVFVLCKAFLESSCVFVLLSNESLFHVQFVRLFLLFCCCNANLSFFLERQTNSVENTHRDLGMGLSLFPTQQTVYFSAPPRTFPNY